MADWKWLEHWKAQQVLWDRKDSSVLAQSACWCRGSLVNAEHLTLCFIHRHAPYGTQPRLTVKDCPKTGLHHHYVSTTPLLKVLPPMSVQRMLCLYGTNAQKEKIRAARSQSTLEAPWKSRVKRREFKHKQVHGDVDSLDVGLHLTFQVLGTLWLQEALGCRRLPFALSKEYCEGLTILNQRLQLSDSTGDDFNVANETLPQLCFKCSVEDRLNKAMRYLKLAHREVERQNEALAEQYALAKERRESAQSSAQLAAKLGLADDQNDREVNGREKEQKEQRVCHCQREQKETEQTLFGSKRSSQKSLVHGAI